MVETNVGFRLGEYLRDIRCSLTFSNGKVMEFESVSFTDNLECKYQSNIMLHGFWASGITEMKVLKNAIGKLKLDYCLSFTGHTEEEPKSIEYVVPIIARRSVYGL